ncbi:uncharacterized protein TRIADDRAFT_57019 [Trichoplax adhaerens]|uniref:Arrestin C-terminal-like domain-containing protein n=1 Tax=Trichoplax adhaerens TaxID=10228 RepID=B3RX72_TRIAD|nr:hypothetical protein TRIADDRAFT_57019 [Trichoplax adhaerens]EDV24820.1 hypothetical protein TRIADDRAFT_57019 [Trichoplax adhaerens]|eukprot:XP_002112710.1 hypothetical protein TRIADDRAFT_57019 [Trichoplax adhaerens]
MLPFVRIFAIELSQTEEVYYPGQAIQGTVILVLKKDIQIYRIKVRLFGRAKSRIQHYDRRQDKWKTYTEEEVFVDDAKSVFGQESAKKEESGNTLEKGRHDFQFHFNLPNAKLPSSYEGSKGNNIRYFIEAWIEMKEENSNPIVTKTFTVLEYIDCNLVDRRTPYAVMEAEKYFCCFLCRHGPLRILASLDRKAYCPGENIHLREIQIENNSNVAVDAVKMKLVQSVLYKARGRRSKGEKIYANKKTTLPLSKDTATLKNETLTIPALPPTITSRPISISYFVKVYLDIPRAFDLHLTFPIEIATIPIQRTRSIVHSLLLDPNAINNALLSSSLALKESEMEENDADENVITTQPKPVLGPIAKFKTNDSIASALSC